MSTVLLAILSMSVLGAVCLTAGLFLALGLAPALIAVGVLLLSGAGLWHDWCQLQAAKRRAGWP